MNMIARFVDDESGATAIEYGLLAALIAVFCIPVFTSAGTSLFGTFTNITAGIDKGNAK
jgi:pilus assembly protein Flp/PilA